MLEASRDQGLMIPPRRMIYDVAHPVQVADAAQDHQRWLRFSTVAERSRSHRNYFVFLRPTKNLVFLFFILMKQVIPFNKPYLSGKETSYIEEAVRSGKISGNGMFTKKCHAFFQERYGFGKCLLTNSCKDTIESEFNLKLKI